MIKREVNLFLTAVMFYSRIPVPSNIDHSSEKLNKATRYFPLVGGLVGLWGFIFLAFGLLIKSPEVGVILSMAATVWITGAFHEDGFADVCDGFGGGYTKERILEIMKDSRIGAYGAIGIVLLLILKYTLLSRLIASAPTEVNLYVIMLIVLLCGHSLSRLTAISFVFSSNYVREDAQSKAKPIAQKPTNTELFGVLLTGGAPLIVLSFYNWIYVLTLLPLFIVKIAFERYYNKHIGGYTGDCLGAVQQISEVVFYLSIVVIWHFI